MLSRITTSNCSNDHSYPVILYKLCKEEDVLIIPEFVVNINGETVPFSTFDRSRGGAGEFEKRDLYTGSGDVGECAEDLNEVKPPQVEILYDHELRDQKENPTGLKCHNFFIEFSFLQAFGKSLPFFPSLNTLKIEGCCISKDLAESLAFILSEEPGRQITDLSLDGNPHVAEILPLFLSSPNRLRFLSAQRCCLDDEAVKLLAEPLACNPQTNGQKLLALNLGMNNIGNSGVAHLAEALRTNRTLLYLSLMGNRIDDDGASELTNVLKKFELTQSEIEVRRRRIFGAILKKRNTVEKLLGDLKSKTEVERQTSKTSTRSMDRLTTVGKRIRGPDGKLCLSSRDKKTKLSQSKLNSGDKFTGKTRGDTAEEIRKSGATATKSNNILSFNEQFSYNEISTDYHPFVSETFPGEGKLWCNGCWSLMNVNLAFNSLTAKSVENFVDVLIWQNEAVTDSKWGLAKVTLLPGNFIKANSTELQNLHEALASANKKKAPLT